MDVPNREALRDSESPGEKSAMESEPVGGCLCDPDGVGAVADEADVEDEEGESEPRGMMLFSLYSLSC